MDAGSGDARDGGTVPAIVLVGGGIAPYCLWILAPGCADHYVMIALFAFLTAFVVAWIGTMVLLRVSPRRAFVDIPNERSSHGTPKPRHGGIALVGGFLAAYAVTAVLEPDVREYAPLAAGGMILFITGLLDDWRGLSVGVRFAMQFAAAMIAVAFGNVLDHVLLPVVGELALGWLGAPVTILFIMACVNFYNFIDGIDGLAGGGAVIAGLFMALIGTILGHVSLGLMFLAVSGAAIGFLQFNFPPSRIFMGDGGSTFLGYFFAWMAISGASLTPEIPAFIPILILSALFADAGLTLIGRLIRGEKVLQAHHTHYYQRLLSLGFNHKQVTLLEYLFTVLLGFSAVVYFKASSFFTLFLSACWFLVFTAAILKIRGLERGDRLFWERRGLFVVATDVFLIAAAYIGAYFVRMNFQFTDAEGRAMLQALPIVLVVRSAVFFKYGLYRSVWKYTSVSDVVRVIKAVTTGSVIIMTAVVLLYRFVAFPRTLFVIEYFLLITFILGARFSMRLFHEIGKEAHSPDAERYAVIGAGDYGERLAREIAGQAGGRAQVVCFIDDDPRKQGLLLHGAPIVGPVSRAAELCRDFNVTRLAVGIRRAEANSLAAIARAAAAAGVEMAPVGHGGAGSGDSEPAAMVFARIAQELGRSIDAVSSLDADAFDGVRVLITRGGGDIGMSLAGELARRGALVTVQFDTARERALMFPESLPVGIVARVGHLGSASDAAALAEAADPDLAIHSATFGANAEGADQWRWRHIVEETDYLAQAISKRRIRRFIFVSFWGDERSGSTAANAGAVCEARLLASQGLSQVSVACLRLPSVLTGERLKRCTREADDATYAMTDPEAVDVVVALAAEASRGIFVPVFQGAVTAHDVRRVLNGISVRGTRVHAPERYGPLFPAEQVHNSALRGVSRVSGPLYPPNDVFRKVLVTAAVGGTDAARDEWLRIVSGQLYHIVPSGLGSHAQGDA